MFAHNTSNVCSQLRLGGVDLNLAAVGQEETGQSLSVVQPGDAGRGGEVADLADEQPEAGVGDVFERHGQGLAAHSHGGTDASTRSAWASTSSTGRP